MAEGQRATVSLADLTRLSEQENRPGPLTADEVDDFASAALIVLRGMTRREKLRVIRRMRRLLG
jgi:hypothetical protein